MKNGNLKNRLVLFARVYAVVALFTLFFLTASQGGKGAAAEPSAMFPIALLLAVTAVIAVAVGWEL